MPPPLDPRRAFGDAVAAYQAGQLSKCERLCKQIATADPKFADALHLLGVVQMAQESHDSALRSFQRALALTPNDPKLLTNAGLAHQALRRLDDALSCQDRALALRPHDAEILNNRGSVLQSLKRYEEALSCFNEALRARPDNADALFNRAVVLQELQRHADALDSYDSVLRLFPNDAQAHGNRAVVLQQLGRFEDALAAYDRALALKPDDPQTLSNRGIALRELARLDDSLACYERALKLRPKYAFAWSNRGNTLQDLLRYDDALASYDRALALQPDYAEALYNRGATLAELERFDEALTSYRRALTISPDYAVAHWNQALLLLLLGDYEAGLKEYEWRWKWDAFPSARRAFAQPLWLGAESLEGKSILLHSEQGFGDTLQFCRYAPLVAARGARVLLQVQPPLTDVMPGLGKGLEIYGTGDQIPDADFHCPLGSLPLAFGTRLDTISGPTPYLLAPPPAVERWRQRLGAPKGVRVAINWAGNPKFKGDGTRSIGLAPLLPLTSANAIQFYSIQKDLRPGDADILRAHPEIEHLGPEFETFGDTAAAISLMDVIISSDTAVVHLAGALGKPVWTLLERVPDWRWHVDRDDSPWYPTARLFRQDKTRTWESAVERVRAELTTLAGAS